MNPAWVVVVEHRGHHDSPGHVHDDEKHGHEMKKHEKPCRERPRVLLVKISQKVVSDARLGQGKAEQEQHPHHKVGQSRQRVSKADVPSVVLSRALASQNWDDGVVGVESESQGAGQHMRSPECEHVDVPGGNENKQLGVKDQIIYNFNKAKRSSSPGADKEYDINHEVSRIRTCSDTCGGFLERFKLHNVIFTD